MSRQEHRTPWFLWPIVAIGRLIAGIIELTGRFVAILLGFVIVVVGAILTLTFVGAVVGIPLILFGGMLVIRGLF